MRNGSDKESKGDKFLQSLGSVGSSKKASRESSRGPRGRLNRTSTGVHGDTPGRAEGPISRGCRRRTKQLLAYARWRIIFRRARALTSSRGSYRARGKAAARTTHGGAQPVLNAHRDPSLPPPPLGLFSIVLVTRQTDWNRSFFPLYLEINFFPYGRDPSFEINAPSASTFGSRMHFGSLDSCVIQTIGRCVRNIRQSLPGSNRSDRMAKITVLSIRISDGISVVDCNFNSNLLPRYRAAREHH